MAFRQIELEEWNTMVGNLADVFLTVEYDKVFWKLTTSGQNTSKSLYQLQKYGRWWILECVIFGRLKFH